MKKEFFSITLCLLSFINGLDLRGQPEELRVAFYNVENLFFPDNDSLKLDDEFTPEGLRNWSFFRYHQKSTRISQVIQALGEGEALAIIGLAEIENRKVLEDLRYRAPIRKHQYEIIHFESDDRRGIDVAALYDPRQVKLLEAQALKIRWPEDSNFATRDILYARFLDSAEDSIHLFFCHWPSRYGGQQISEPKRIQAALRIRAKIDSILKVEPDAKIIIAGDLNDEWHNASILEYLKAYPPDSAQADLINLMAETPANEGSHRYQGVWSYLDQIIVSPSIYKQLVSTDAQRAAFPFLLAEDERYPGLSPYRSFVGIRYQEGFSDHLPVYIDLKQGRKPNPKP